MSCFYVHLNYVSMLLYFGVILCFFVEHVYNLEMITVIF